MSLERVIERTYCGSDDVYEMMRMQMQGKRCSRERGERRARGQRRHRGVRGEQGAARGQAPPPRVKGQGGKVEEVPSK